MFSVSIFTNEVLSTHFPHVLNVTGNGQHSLLLPTIISRQLQMV